MAFHAALSHMAMPSLRELTHSAPSGYMPNPSPSHAWTSDNALYVTQVRHDRVGFMLMPINKCYPYMQKKHDTITQDSV